MSYKCNKCGKVYANKKTEGAIEMAGQVYCQSCGVPTEEIKDEVSGSSTEGFQYSSKTVINSGSGTQNNGLLGDDIAKILKVNNDSFLEALKTSIIASQSVGVAKDDAMKCVICGQEVSSHQYDHNKHRCVDCIIKDGERMMEAKLWDDAVDEFKIAEPMLNAKSLPLVRERIGYCYLMDKEKKKAMRYLALAETDRSNYLLGTNMQKDDIDVAIRYLKKAAENGILDAQRRLGVIYLGNDERVSEDYEESAKWFLMAAKQGAADCQYYLGYVYGILGKEYEKKDKAAADDNFKNSRLWFQKAAEQGILDAQRMLSRYLFEGLGGEKNVEEGMTWLRKAADNGLPEAEFSLAEVLLDGDYGVKKDTENGVKWLEKAANNDIEKAQYRLAISYENGIGVARDYKKAEEWLRKLASKHYIDVAFELAKLLIHHNNKIEEGVALMKAVAEGGYVDAMYEMGLFAERENKLQSENLSEPVRWYKKGAEGKHGPSMTRLGHLFEEGRLVPQDYTKAEQWYRKAMEAGDSEARDIVDERFSGRTLGEKWRMIKKFAEAHSGLIRTIVTIIIILLLIRGCNAACQSCKSGSSSKSKSALVYHESEVDEPAVYSDGSRQLTKDLKSLFRNTKGIKGRVDFELTIDEKGFLKKMKMTKDGESAELPMSELQSITSSLKNWTPAKKNGEPVSSVTEPITINF